MKRNNHICLLWAFLVVFLLAVPACINNDDYDFDKLSDKVNWTPNFIGPVGHGSFTLWYLLNQHEENQDSATIVIGEDGLIHIRHREPDVFDYSADSVISFPTQNTQNFDFTVPLSGTIPPSPTPVELGSDTTTLDFDIEDGVLLLELELTAVINFAFTNPLSDTVTVEVTLPTGTVAGNIAKHTFSIPSGVSNDSWNLSSGLNLDFSADYPNNTLPFVLKFTLNPFESSLVVAANSSISVDYQVQNIAFTKATGDFSQQVIDVGSGGLDMGVDFWDDITGTFTFNDPRINLTFRNGIGVPFEINVDLTGYNSDGEFVDLAPDPLRPGYPVNEAEVDALIESTVSFNKDNSNIVPLMALPPSDSIAYSGSVTLNPDPVDINTAPNIIKNTSSIAVDMEIDIPLDFSAQNLTLQDTIDDISISDAEKVIHAKLIITASNGLPLDVKMDKIYLTDAAFNKLDSISDAQFFTAAEVFPEGHAQAGEVNEASVEEVTHEIEFTQDLIAKLDQTENIIIVASISTSNKGTVPVKFSGNNTLKFAIAIEAEADLNN